MELPNLQWIISVVLSNTTNIPPFCYIRPYRCPPCSVHDKARRSRMIHCNATMYSAPASKIYFKSAHKNSNSPIKNHVLKQNTITLKPVSNLQTLKTLMKTQLKNSNHSNTSLLRIHPVLEICGQLKGIFLGNKQVKTASPPEFTIPKIERIILPTKIHM